MYLCRLVKNIIASVFNKDLDLMSTNPSYCKTFHFECLAI